MNFGKKLTDEMGGQTSQSTYWFEFVYKTYVETILFVFALHVLFYNL